MVNGIRGTGINIEGDAKILKRFFHHGVVLIHHLLRVDPFGPRFEGDGNTVFVASADELHVLFFKSPVSDKNIGGNITAGQVAYVHRSVGIGEGGGN